MTLETKTAPFAGLQPIGLHRHFVSAGRRAIGRATATSAVGNREPAGRREPAGDKRRGRGNSTAQLNGKGVCANF